MRNRTRLGMAALVSITGFFVACGDNSSNPTTLPIGGTASGGGGSPAAGGGAAGTATAGTATAGTATAGTEAGGTFTTAGTAGTGGTDVAGTGGAAAGTGGTTAGTGGTAAGSGGTGGAPHVIVPTVFLIDNIILRPKQSEGGAGGGGAGGMGGAGADAGGVPAIVGGAGAGGDVMVGGAGAGPVAPLPDFALTFDTDIMPLALNPNGFSPGPGNSAGPPILNSTVLSFGAAMGYPTGAVRVSVPFTVAMQQADIFANLPAAVNLTGYELIADVNMTETGDVGTCASAWMYVYGASGYANDASGEPMAGKTQQLTKGTWTRVRLDLDGPYGVHSTMNFPNYKPELVSIWGVQLNTWGCP